MKTPSFWNNRGLISSLLLPAGKIYAGLTALRLKCRRPRRVNVPVVCIGNLTAGGTGKTPVAAAIAEILQRHGLNPFFVSRGYGGTLSGVIVDSLHHSAAQTGDEPLLLSRTAPVSINPDRFRAAELAVSHGAKSIVMDDGFQNPGLHKDLSFLVFDGGVGLGNRRPIPSGPLRENLASGLKRADAAIIVGKDCCHLAGNLSPLPVFSAMIEAQSPSLPDKPVIAFAGIGRPRKFYDSLRQLGFSLQQTIDFPDHHFYPRAELQQLIDRAQKSGAVLYTTAKDFVKIPVDLQPLFQVLEIRIRWQDPAAVEDFILSRLQDFHSQSAPSA